MNSERLLVPITVHRRSDSSPQLYYAYDHPLLPLPNKCIVVVINPAAIGVPADFGSGQCH